MTYKFLGLLAGGLALAATASPAMAAKVSVEIEGGTVIQPPAVVDTAASVSKPGGAACSGAVPATALEAAVGGDWDGPDYAVTRIRDEEHQFGPGGSWSFYVNGRYSNDTICTAPLKDGDKVLLYWTNAYASAGYDEPVLLDAPTTVAPGQAFTVKVSEVTTAFDGNGAGTSTIAPSAGATVSVTSRANATTGADGTATLTVTTAGPFTVGATKGNRARALINGCATTGSDGYCGTTKASPPPSPFPPETCPPVATGARARAAACAVPPADKTAALGRITGITEGKKYKQGKGPRQLAGKVDSDRSGLADVRLRLTRTDGRKCTTYDAKTEKFKTIKKCGAARGTWFSIGAKADWTYLLPSKLGRGRYVLDVQVVDKAGNKTTQLARGTSRVVFTVA